MHTSIHVHGWHRSALNPHKYVGEDLHARFETTYVGRVSAARSALDRLWYPQKSSVSFEDILRTLRHATWQERIFSDPALDAHTRKILQPFVEWAKTLT